jgi:hypothetical protein
MPYDRTGEWIDDPTPEPRGAQTRPADTQVHIDEIRRILRESKSRRDREASR